MAIKIIRSFYTTIRTKFYQMARIWNGINSVIRLNGASPSWKLANPNNADGGRWVPGWKGSKIQMNEDIPESIRNTKIKDYSGQPNEVYQNISEESNRIHTLGNENNIRDSIISLNDITHQEIGSLEGLTKQPISEKGSKINVNLATLKLSSKNKDLQEIFDKDNGVKKYSQLSNNPNDSNYLKYPYQTSATNITTSGVKSTDVLTYNIDENYKLDKSEIVKYQDYEEINNVLNKIEGCLAKRNNWFDANGRCQITCQVKCQHTCQLSCQGCNRKMCHNQHCGSV